jgi:predicted RNase H-like HicB family nuclease
MVIDLFVHLSDDGFSSEVPSIKGCETWAKDEDEAIDKAVELVKFYLNLPASAKMKVDKARKEENLNIYKLIFDK